MRQIKFRGLDKYNCWVYGYLFEDITPARHCCYIIEGSFVPSLSMPAENFIPVKKETVGQFTGLLDKNGREIYEGDILESEQALYKVIFIDGLFVVIMIKKKENIGGLFVRGTLYALLKEPRERDIPIVISNIYENPELLEAKDETDNN